MEPFVDRARRFNRFYTRAIGMLGEGYLGSGFTLAEARVIYELANRAGPTARAIGKALEMDAGYLSRVLKRCVHFRIVRSDVDRMRLRHGSTDRRGCDLRRRHRDHAFVAKQRQ